MSSRPILRQTPKLTCAKYVDEAWPTSRTSASSKGASRDRLTFTTNMKEALSQADLVQENGPERRISR